MFDDNDLLDEEPIGSSPQLEQQEEPYVEPHIDNEDENQSSSTSNDLLTNLLNRVGIKDRNNILFEDENGQTSKKWDDISLEELINILTHHDDPETGLDNEEIQLINLIRSSKMSPKEYAQYLANVGVQNYLLNNQVTYNPTYEIDNIEDDVLYISDIIAKVGEENVTEQELQEMLENAKSNPTLFQKQIQAIRQEYKNIEDSNRQAQIEYQHQSQLDNYNRFAESVENSIRNFTNFAGMDIDMNEDEMEELYDFIVGFDQSGTNTFSKVLKNPNLLVKMAWFALNGDEVFNDLNNSFNLQLTKAYKKGLDDGKKSGSNLYINNSKNGYSNSDALDRW